MKTVQISVGFTGYPNGHKRHFPKDEVADLSDAYADLVIGKGLGREKPAEPATPEPSKGGKKVTSHETLKPED